MDNVPAVTALKAGCSDLRLPETAAKELIRFLIVKRLVGDECSSRLSPSAILDRLLHWVLLNTDVRDLIESHVGKIWHTTTTAQQPDVQKMQRRCEPLCDSPLLSSAACCQKEYSYLSIGKRSKLTCCAQKILDTLVERN